MERFAVLALASNKSFCYDQSERKQVFDEDMFGREPFVPATRIVSGSATKRKVLLKRLSFTLLVLVSMILGVHFLADSMQPDQFVEVRVAEGDTLWGIATRFAGNEDPRKVIHSIKKINRLNSGFIMVGQVLRVPLYQ